MDFKKTTQNSNISRLIKIKIYTNIMSTNVKPQVSGKQININIKLSTVCVERSESLVDLGRMKKHERDSA